MDKTEFQEFEKELISRGYKKAGSYNTHDDYCYYKGFRKVDDDGYGDSRYQYQVFFAVYDYIKLAKRLGREDIPKEIMIQPTILVSRNSDEREDYTTMSSINIDVVEKLAEGFFRFVCENVELKNK